jgi:TetR/AcrR family transcriptional regulator, tetracycline repressor protein
VAALTLGRIPTGPNVMRWAEWTLGLLRGAGIPDRIAAFAGDLLGLYLGATGYEATLPPMASPTGEPLSVEESTAMVRDYFASLPADQFPNVLATLDELFSGDPQERFELGLDVILRGLASYAR